MGKPISSRRTSTYVYFVKQRPTKHLSDTFSPQPDRIKRLLNSTGTGNQEIKDKLEGMEYLLAVGLASLFSSILFHDVFLHGPQMMSKGRNMSEFFPDVVKNVIVSFTRVTVFAAFSFHLRTD